MEQETPKPVEKKVDEKWYGRFTEASSLSTSDYLSTDPKARETQKELFVKGEIVNPELGRNKTIEPGELDLRAGTLLELKRDIIKNEPNEVVAQAYRWRINEKIADIYLLKSAIEGDMRKFKKWSEFIFGKPSKEVFDFTVSQINLKIDLGLKSENPEIKNAAKDLRGSLIPTSTTSETPALPTSGELAFAKETTLNEFGDVINTDDSDPGRKFDSQEIKESFEKALNTLGISGWEIVIDSDARTTFVSQEKKMVTVPEAKSLKLKSLNQLILHELGTHTARREKGERSKLMLLGLGLDRYLKGDEGVATMREQVLNEKVDDFAGFEGHLSISLAYGFAGEPLDFRGTYEVLNKYFYLNSLLKGKDSESAKSSAQNTAWNNAIRIFMGTDYKTPGVCYTKDIAYREGSIGVWDVIRKNPEEMHRFSVGKYDPANTRHIWILSQLGISDEDLQANIVE